jgi:hypothetical protein
MDMETRISPEEVVRRGEDYYLHELQPKVDTAANKGKFLVLDVVSGTYEIEEEDLTASRKVLSRRPDGVLYGIRIGFPTAYKV